MKITDTSPTYKAAVIGLGFVGAGDQVSGDALGQQVSDLDGTHAQALADHGQVELVAGSSRDEGRRKRFTEGLNVEKTYEDWRSMLASEDLDFVSVATNSPYHAEITMACADAGVRAVLCEKPIATKLSDADRMIAACRAHDTLLAINHNRRWHPLWCAVQNEIKAGTIGQMGHVAIHWPSGRLGNIGTHMFDAIALLLGNDAKAVSGTLDPVVHPDCRGPQYHDPGGWGMVLFQNDVKVFVDATQTAQAPFELRIIGSLGQIILGDEARIEPWAGEGRTITTPPDGPSSVALAVDDLVHCLTYGGQLLSTGEDARRALEIIIGFHVSDRLRGQWVSLPLAGKDRDLEVMIG